MSAWWPPPARAHTTADDVRMGLQRSGTGATVVRVSEGAGLVVGDVVTVSVAGKGRQTKTGSLGDVMQESIQAALTVVRSRAVALGIAENFHEDLDVHIHVPEGATPKDGPSAGITIASALVSLARKQRIKASFAMTGELTLTGHVLAVGGIREKIIAARRARLEQLILPASVRNSFQELPDYLKENIEVTATLSSTPRCFTQ